MRLVAVHVLDWLLLLKSKVASSARVAAAVVEACKASGRDMRRVVDVGVATGAGGLWAMCDFQCRVSVLAPPGSCVMCD